MNSTIFMIPDNVVEKTGPRLVGFLLHWGLFGVLCMQVYLYYLGFPKDPIFNKILVLTVYGLEVLQTIIITQSAFHVFGSGYGNFSVYDQVDLVWFTIPLCSGMVAFIAEMFYAYRIRILSGSYKAPAVISTARLFELAFVQLGGAIGTAVIVKQSVLFSRLLSPSLFTTAIWNGGSALCDVIITAYMTYFLSRRSGPNSLQSTKVLLQRLIRIVIETGMITAAFAILNLILVLLPSRPFYFEASASLLAKVYSNSMMALLNSRMKLNSNDFEGNSLDSDNVGQLQGFNDDTSRGNTSRISSGVMVTRERVEFPDADVQHMEDKISSMKLATTV